MGDNDTIGIKIFGDVPVSVVAGEKWLAVTDDGKEATDAACALHGAG